MKNVFEQVSPTEYHQNLYRYWLQLEKDGIVPKASMSSFEEYSEKFFAYCRYRGSVPEYDTILGWFITQER